MLHVPALPGSPQNTLEFDAVIDWVMTDAEALAAGGADGFILENFGDIPFYPGHAPPHTVAFLTALGCEIRRRFRQPLGINVLRNDAESALAIASATEDRKSTRLNSSHQIISYAVFCLKKKTQ